MIRKIQENDISTVRELYTKFPGFRKPDINMLPGNGLDGFIYLKDNKIVAALYVYMATNAATCWIDWVVADKDYVDSDKHDIIVKLIEHTTDEMREAGYLWAMGMVTIKQLEDLYIKAGFEGFSAGKELIKTL